MISAGIDVNVSVTTDGGGPIVISSSTKKIATACTATETPIAPPNRRCRCSSRKEPAEKDHPAGSTPLTGPPGGGDGVGAPATGDAGIVGLVCWEVMNAVRPVSGSAEDRSPLDPN